MIADSSDGQNLPQPGMAKEKMRVAPSPLSPLKAGARTIPRLRECLRTCFANRPY